MFKDVYRGRRVLVTGHTGFKGSWLAFWLKKLGAELCGVALPMETEHVHFDLLGLDMRSETADIRDREKIAAIMAGLRADPPKDLCGSPVTKVIDYLEPEKTGQPKSNVLQFFDEAGDVVSVRPSGTEPKIKFYFGAKGADADDKIAALKAQFCN